MTDPSCSNTTGSVLASKHASRAYHERRDNGDIGAQATNISLMPVLFPFSYHRGFPCIATRVVGYTTSNDFTALEECDSAYQKAFLGRVNV